MAEDERRSNGLPLAGAAPGSWAVDFDVLDVLFCPHEALPVEVEAADLSALLGEAPDQLRVAAEIHESKRAAVLHEGDLVARDPQRRIARPHAA